ncbi:hypothetical protein GCM10027418_24000 [Mariniluteicoccus endophyticus]
MVQEVISQQKIMDHVRRLQDEHPPITLDSVDRTVKRPDLVRQRYSHVLDYLARVELEVDRNVLELLVLLPDPEEVDRYFYEDVWQPQEIQHGLILDRASQDIGLPPSEPMLEIQMSMKFLGALSHLRPIQDVTRLMYYLTGASTERQATLAYNTFAKGLREMGEEAMAHTIVEPIKRQEPGHFAFYSMSATSLVHSGLLKPWQMWLTRQLRDFSYELVGINHVKEYQADMGGVMVELGLDEGLEAYAREIGRLEARVLWANRNGMEFPPYFLTSMRESVEMYRERGFNARLQRSPTISG